MDRPKIDSERWKERFVSGTNTLAAVAVAVAMVLPQADTMSLDWVRPGQVEER